MRTLDRQGVTSSEGTRGVSTNPRVLGVPLESTRPRPRVLEKKAPSIRRSTKDQGP